jgi:hypothetical protein
MLFFKSASSITCLGLPKFKSLYGQKSHEYGSLPGKEKYKILQDVPCQAVSIYFSHLHHYIAFFY